MAVRICFVISPIGERDSASRRRADGVLNEIIRPALEPKGYDVERADHDKTPGIVTEAFIARIVDADLVVADLTGLNPNVMYELAVRHASGKAVIQILEEGHELPFDIHSQNTLYFNGDLAGRSEAIRNLQAAEEAVQRTSDLGNPIKRTVELRALKASEKGQDSLIARAIVEIQSELARLRSAFSVSVGSAPSATADAEHQSAELFHEAIRVLKVPPFSPQTAVLHMIAYRQSVSEPELIAGLTEHTDSEHRERTEGDYRMELRKLIRQGLVERDADEQLRLNPTISAGYVPPRDPYTRRT